MGEATEPASLRRHYREIYRYVRRRSPSGPDAEDVTQDVFADAARALGSGETALELVAEPPAEYGPEVSEALRGGIERLPRQQRQVVLMKLVQDRSFAEIASALDATEGACRMRFLRGLEQLRAFLEEQEVRP